MCSTERDPNAGQHEARLLEHVGERDRRGGGAERGGERERPLAAGAVVRAVPARDVAAGEEAGREARPGDHAQVQVGERAQLLRRARQTTGPWRRDHLGQREVVAEREQAGLRPARVQLAQARDGPVRDAEAADRPGAHLLEQRVRPFGRRPRRVVAVQEEDVDALEAQQRSAPRRPRRRPARASSAADGSPWRRRRRPRPARCSQRPAARADSPSR